MTVVRAFPLLTALALAACVGTTGGEVVSFGAQLAGPSLVTDHRLAFTSGRGLAVTLTKATLRVGAVYMNRSKPIPVAQEKACISTGTYVGEALGGAEADLLSGAPARFARGGQGTTDRAVTGELWLSGGDIDALEDKTVVATVEGEVVLPAGTKAFRGSVTLGSNRRDTAVDPARPGADAPCKQRIVSPIPVDLSLASGGLLTVRVDPRAWFALVPFEDLREESGVLVFDDADTNASSVGLADGIRAPQGVYRFEWSAP